MNMVCGSIWAEWKGQRFRSSMDFRCWDLCKKRRLGDLWVTLLRRGLQGTEHLASPSSPPSNCSVVNPAGVSLSATANHLLSNVPKFCINVRPSRLDIVSSIHAVVRRLPGDSEKASFMDQCPKKMSGLVDCSHHLVKHNFKGITGVKENFLFETSCYLRLTRLAGLRKFLAPSSTKKYRSLFLHCSHPSPVIGKC